MCFELTLFSGKWHIEECLIIVVVVVAVVAVVVVVVIIEICKAHTPQLKALNKHNTCRLMYMEMENVLTNAKTS